MPRLGRYNLIRQIGRGGMAEVWKARFQGPAGFEKTVAIKKVLPDQSSDRELMEMFVEEAKLVAQLVHPAIVQIVDFGDADGTYFMAMEYVPGQHLGGLLKRLADREVRMPSDMVVYIIGEAAAALAYAHDARTPHGEPLGIVHRDISPANVLVSYNGDVKVTDFGIAKYTDSPDRTKIGNVKGKVGYMSPEQARAQRLDQRSDIFSLGIVLYELATGKKLIRGNNGREMIAKIARFEMPDLTHVDEPFRPILRGALARSVHERYPNAGDLEAELSRLQDRSGRVAARDGLAALLGDLFAEEKAAEVVDQPGGTQPFERPAMPPPPAAAPTAAAPPRVPETVVGAPPSSSTTSSAGAAPAVHAGGSASRTLFVAVLVVVAALVGLVGGLIARMYWPT